MTSPRYTSASRSQQLDVAMTEATEAQPPAVAHLLFRRAQSPQVTCMPNIPKGQTIRPRESFDIGRKVVEQALNIREPTISAHHLRFRCLVYEDEDPQAVAPMVYVRVLSSNPVRIIYSAGGLHDGEVLVGKLDADVLLSDGDILQLTANTSILFRDAGAFGSNDTVLDDVQQADIRTFSDRFVVSRRRVGFGGQASVFLAAEQPGGRQVACKITSWPGTKADARVRLQRDPNPTAPQHERWLKSIEKCATQLQREFQILKNISHPNIINIQKVICTPRNVYIFEELITGGDLLSFLDQRGALSEPHAAVVIQQLLKAVDHLHDQGVVHRDIKPENILMTSWRHGARVVLTDFGHSRVLVDANKAMNNSAPHRMHTTVGTRGYMAPEMFPISNGSDQDQGYSKAIDMWSVGCIAAMLLTGEMPFPGNARSVSRSQEKPPTWDLSTIDYNPAWESIGRKAKSFVRGCLNVEETQRLTAEQALKHVWFTDRRYASEMQAAYLRAIAGWAPGIKSSPFIEFRNVPLREAPATLASKYAEQLSTKVTSPFFNSQPSPMPTLASLPTHSPFRHPIRKQTKLPSLLEDAEESNGVEHSRPSAMECATQLADLSQPPSNSSFSNIAANEMTGRFSIEDFAPPTTQLSGPPSSGLGGGLEEGLTQFSMPTQRLPHPPRTRQRLRDPDDGRVGVDRNAAALRMPKHSWQNPNPTREFPQFRGDVFR